jgi:hypothetical protein
MRDLAHRLLLAGGARVAGRIYRSGLSLDLQPDRENGRRGTHA